MATSQSRRITNPAMRHRWRPSQVRSFGVSNFKSVEHAEFPLLPLTIVTGANSAGKSSLLQSLLFLAQSANDNQIALNGSLVSLGEAADVVRTGTEQITVSVVVDAPKFLEPDVEQTTCRFSIDLVVTGQDLVVGGATLEEGGAPLLLTGQGGPSARDFRKVSALAEGGTLLQIRLPRSDRDRDRPRLLEFQGLWPSSIHSKLRSPERARIAKRLLDASTTSIRRRNQLLGALRSRLSHVDGAVDDPAVVEASAELFDQVLRSRGSRETANAIRQVDDDRLEAIAKWLATDPHRHWDSKAVEGRGFANPMHEDGVDDEDVDDDFAAEAFHYLRCVKSALDEIVDSVVYLGPLRDEPRVVQALGRGSKHTPVGTRGENMADFLARRSRTHVSYRCPEGEEKWTTLREAVSEWVAYLGIGEGVTVSDRGKLGRTVRLSLNKVDRDLTTIGVGASQLLPVVVLVLGAPSGSTLLLEQPELHLHPAVQSRLADFLSLARPDVRSVIETHSENLLTRLRLRVVRREVEPTDITILFGEQDNGVSHFRSLGINSYGDLGDWPSGFFDAVERDSIEIVREVQRRLHADR